MSLRSPPWHLPEPPVVWLAIDIYLRRAYLDKAVPIAVGKRLDSLRAIDPEAFYQCGVIERTNCPQGHPTRYALRLGNREYPHMKLVIERAPSGGGYLLRADTHDAHCRPDPQSREFGMFCALTERNREIAAAIETGWEENGLPTFKQFLKADLARRISEAKASEEPESVSSFDRR